MSTEHNCFVAEAVFEETVHVEKADVRPVTENLLFLVKANDQSSALSRAEMIARSKEHSYKNEQDQLVSWTFVRLVEVTQMLDQQFEEGAELRSTMTDVHSRPVIAERR